MPAVDEYLRNDLRLVGSLLLGGFKGNFNLSLSALVNLFTLVALVFLVRVGVLPAKTFLKVASFWYAAGLNSAGPVKLTPAWARRSRLVVASARLTGAERIGSRTRRTALESRDSEKRILVDVGWVARISCEGERNVGLEESSQLQSGK